MRQRLEARGETLWVNVNYVDFGASAFEHNSNPNEYAEFVLAAYQHIQSKYGFVPDTWEVMLEPDNGTTWFQVPYALAVKAAGDRLAANGFTPRFVGPSCVSGIDAIVYIDALAATPGAMQYITEFSYHRYRDIGPVQFQQIIDRAIQYNKKTSMLEWISADNNTLHSDLKQGRNSSWQQFTLAGPTSWGPDSGDRYYVINDSNVSNPVIIMGSRTKLLRQYFKFIRAGAQRIDAMTGNNNFDPVAFINTNGKYVVAVKASTGGSFNTNGLPPGTYGIKFTTASQYNIDLPDVTISSGQPVTANIPAAGVITIYGR